MGRCKECAFWCPEGRKGWGFCEGWLNPYSKFTLVETTDAPVSEYIELETREDFGCTGFLDNVEGEDDL